jgi:hypothetical protein
VQQQLAAKRCTRQAIDLDLSWREVYQVGLARKAPADCLTPRHIHPGAFCRWRVRVSSQNRLLFSVLAIAALTNAAAVGAGVADDVDSADIAQGLVAGYPDDVSRVDGDKVVFKDGTELPLGDGAKKPFEAWLAHPSIEDMFLYHYPRGAAAVQPPLNFDPGRARNDAFFTKVYGDCRMPGFAATLTTIRWLPTKSGQRIAVSRRNGVAEHLQAVSNELDALPHSYDRYLMPSAGGFLCRTIAGTTERSAHGYGIAIDIATKHAHYWRWAKNGPQERPIYRNEIPLEIVSIFEKHGFLWGGRWSHYDTMHFEYRPELLGESQ